VLQVIRRWWASLDWREQAILQGGFWVVSVLMVWGS
jgi:hypothetical protein